MLLFFFFNDTATTEIYTLSLHDRSSDLNPEQALMSMHGSPVRGARSQRLRRPWRGGDRQQGYRPFMRGPQYHAAHPRLRRSEEYTSELQSRQYLVCRLLLEKKKNTPHPT